MNKKVLKVLNELSFLIIAACAIALVYETHRYIDNEIRQDMCAQSFHEDRQ